MPAAPTGASTSTEVNKVGVTSEKAGLDEPRPSAFGGEQRAQTPPEEGVNSFTAEMERLVLEDQRAPESDDWAPLEGYVPLFLWPASCRYDDWIATVKADLRDGRSSVEHLIAAIDGAVEDGNPWPPRENPAGPGPALHLLRRLRSALERRGQRETLVRRPRPPTREEPVGRSRAPRAVRSRPPPGQKNSRAHLYALPLSRPAAPRGRPGPAPRPGATPAALKAWVQRSVDAIGADDEGVAACNESADALLRGRWAGTARQLEHARETATVYKAPREPVPSARQPGFAARAFVVCGEYVSSIEALARHAPCFSRRVDVYQACRRHFAGQLPELEWAQTTRELEASQLCFRRWKEAAGGHGPVRCRALPVPRPPAPAPAAPPLSWPRVPHWYVARRVGEVTESREPYMSAAEPVEARVRYQGAVVSRLLDCDFSCACAGDCDTERDDLDPRPGERFWADPTGESPGAWYRYQGAGASLPVVVSATAGDVKVTHSFPQVDLLLQAMAGPGGEYPVARKFTRVAALLIGVGSAGSVLSAASHIASFVAGDEWLFGLMATQVAALTARISAGGWRHQGPEDEGFFQVASRVVFQSAVLVAVKEASGSVSEGVALAIKEFGKAFKIAAAKKTAEGVLDWVCQALKEFWQRLMSAWEQRSWTPLWGTGSDPRRWAAHARGVIDHHQLLVTAEPRPGGARAQAVADLVEKGQIPPLLARGLTPGQYLAAVEDLRDQGQRLLDGLPPGPLGASIKALTGDLAHKAVAVAASIRGATTRSVPYFIYVWGPAGTGKTNLLHAVFKAVGAHAGLPTDDKARWPWQRGVNFQDGLDSSHWTVALDDVDHVKGSFGVRDELFPAVVTRLVNNEPFPVEAAAVEDKGTRFAMPLLVTQSSNFDAEQVAAYGACPEAFWRRVGLHARVEVKPEFRRKVGGKLLDELDPALCEGRLDIYNIYLGTYRGAQDDAKQSYFVAATEPIGIAEFVQLAQQGFADHQARQHRLLTQREAGDLCATCFLPTAVPHGCPLERKQMYRTGYAVGEGETVLDVDEDDPDDLEPLTEGGRFDPPDWFKHGLLGSYRAWRAVCGFGDEALREAGSCLRDACVVGAFRVCSCVAAPSCTGCCPAVVRRLGAVSPRAAAGAVAATMAAAMAMQVVEEALGEFPVATAATVLAAAGAVYAVYRGGRWLLQARGAGVDTSQWIPVPPVFGPQAPSTPLNATWTRDQVVAAVARSQFPYRTSGTTAFALALKPNLLAVPTHLLPTAGEFELDLGVGWQKFPWRPEWSEVSATNRELTYVAVRTRGDAGVAQFLPEVTNMSVMQYDEAELSPGPARPFPGPFRVTRGPRGELAVSGPAGTQDGDCGRSYILRSGKSWWVGAIHYAGLEVGGTVVSAMGCPLSRREVEAVARRLDPGVTTGGPTVIPQGLTVTAAGTPWVLRGPPAGYSEVLTALANGRAKKVAYWGTLVNGPPGASPRSTLRPTIFAHHFRDLEEKYCGVSPYWGPPVFKGAMVDGVWESPQQHAFDAGLGVLPDRATWIVAIMDYLAGVERLDFGELRELSLAEALAGQPELWANPVNPSTSSGLPKNQPKWMQIYRCFQDLKLEPELYAIIDEIERLVDSGAIPTPPGAWVLKDEPRKPGGEARLFTVLPAAYNIVLARRLSAVYAQMRAHPEFFECWIGIDMTSPDVERLIRFWRHVCPDLDRMGDADTTKQDKSFSTASWTAVRMVYSAIAHFAGLNREVVENLVRSQEFVKYIWKGDVFESAQDPSGVKGVIENNSIDCSVTMRFAYYAARPEVVASIPWEAWLERFPTDPTVPPGLPLTFRRDCANAQFGDDNAHALAPGVPNFVRPDLLLRERGILVTSGDKSGVVRQGPLSSITFLKREFKFDEELGYHLAALAPKSILKTALVRMRTSLSDADHAALALTQVVREAVFHGPEFFEEISSRALAAAKECGLVGHRLLRIHSYENYRERLRRGVFSVYKDIGEVGSDAYFAVDGAGLIRADQLSNEE